VPDFTVGETDCSYLMYKNYFIPPSKLS